MNVMFDFRGFLALVVVMLLLYQKIYFLLLPNEGKTIDEQIRGALDESLALMLMGNDHSVYGL
jgi:hypothetical protein